MYIANYGKERVESWKESYVKSLDIIELLYWDLVVIVII